MIATPHLRLVCSLAVALVCNAVGVATEATPSIPEDIKQLEDAILANRRSINSGHFRVKRVYDSPGEKEHQEWEITTWIDGLRVREELKREDADVTQCYGDKYFYRNTFWKLPKPRNSVLTVMDLKLVDRKNQYYFHEPLMLMLHPLWYRAAVNYHMETVVGSPGRTQLRTDTTTWDGRDARKVSFAIGENSLAYWVVPSQGHSIVRMEQRWQDREKKEGMQLNCVQCSVQHTRDGIWFPTKVRYQEFLNGGLLTQEDLDIEVLSVNQPIALAMFEPETMGIPADTLVQRMPRDPGGELKWDGQRIVRMTEEDLLKRMARRPDGSGTFRRVLLLSLSLVFAGIGGAVMWWRYMRKPSDAR